MTASTAAELVAGYPEGRIAAQVEHFDWLRAEHPKKIKESPGGYLAASIRKDYATPEGFVSRAERAGREEAERQRQRREAEGRRRRDEAEAREEEARGRIAAYLKALSPAGLEELDRDVFADPEVEAIHEGQTPGFRRLYLDALRRDRVRTRLDLPGPPEG